MDRDFILFFFREVIVLGFYISAPMLILGLLVGLVISIFQAMTQINEQTLTFLPKLVAAGIGFVAFGPFMLEKIITFTTNLFTNLGQFVN